MDSDNNILTSLDKESIREYASFGQRVLASVIDFFVLLPFIAINGYNIITYHSFPVWIVVTLLSMAYKPLMEYYYGATIGKMQVNIRVVGNTTENITIHQAITRYLPWIITNIVSFYTTMELFSHPDYSAVTDLESYVDLMQSLSQNNISSIAGWILIASVINILFNAKKQAWHDLIAGTYVIKN